jgi:hypothetical protein
MSRVSNHANVIFYYFAPPSGPRGERQALRSGPPQRAASPAQQSGSGVEKCTAQRKKTRQQCEFKLRRLRNKSLV